MNQFLPEENRKKSTNKLQGYMGVFMGFLYLFIGGAIFMRNNNGTFEGGFLGLGNTMTYIFVGVLFMYGIFRIYRAYKILRG